MSANMKGFAGEELYEEGDDWSDDMDDREVPDYWGEEIEKEFHNAERKMLKNGFSKPYVASMIARMKAEKKSEK